MKWIVIILIGAIGAWAYFNNFSFDTTGAKTNTTNTLKQEKTMKKFFGADEQNKQQTKEVLENF